MGSDEQLAGYSRHRTRFRFEIILFYFIVTVIQLNDVACCDVAVHLTRGKEGTETRVENGRCNESDV